VTPATSFTDLIDLTDLTDVTDLTGSTRSAPRAVSFRGAGAASICGSAAGRDQPPPGPHPTTHRPYPFLPAVPTSHSYAALAANSR